MCGFIKGMGAGLFVGVCLGMCMNVDKRRSKRMLHKAVRGMNDVIDNVAENLGL